MKIAADIAAGKVADNAAAEVVAGFERLFELLRRLTPPDGMSLTAASTLRRLEHHGPHRLSALAVAEGVTQPAMTQLVTRLERDGLVCRGAHPGDGRVVVVSITAAGRRAVHRRRTARAERVSALLAALPAADRAAIAAALPALDRLGELADSGAGRPRAAGRSDEPDGGPGAGR